MDNKSEIVFIDSLKDAFLLCTKIGPMVWSIGDKNIVPIFTERELIIPFLDCMDKKHRMPLNDIEVYLLSDPQGFLAKADELKIDIRLNPRICEDGSIHSKTLRKPGWDKPSSKEG